MVCFLVSYCEGLLARFLNVIILLHRKTTHFPASCHVAHSVISAQSFLVGSFNVDYRDGGMAQWLKSFAALAEYPGMVPSTHMAAHKHLEL